MIKHFNKIFKEIGTFHFWTYWQFFWTVYCATTTAVNIYQRSWIWVILDIISMIANFIGFVYWLVKYVEHRKNDEIN